jgi:hypothetical protein
MPVRTLALALATLAIAACSTPGPATSALATGTEVEFEGRLETVDTAPWAYDGNARLVVETAAHGDVAVELPARWNLCKATGIGDAGNFSVGDRVRAVGTVTAPGTVTVCERATHRIARLP